MKKLFYVLVVLSMLLAFNVSAFQFFGYAYNVTKGPVSNTNVSLIAYDMTQMDGPPTPVHINWTMTNASGFFNLSMPYNDSWSYRPVLRHFNGLNVDYIGPSLPQLPAQQVQSISPVDFYLKEGATINITAQGRAQASGSVDELGSWDASDYLLGLEWDSDSQLWAYVNTTGFLVKLNPDFTFNTSYQMTMPGIIDVEYVTPGFWYFANSTTVLRYYENVTAGTLNFEAGFPITCDGGGPCNYITLSSIEYDEGNAEFYIMALVLAGDPITTVDRFNMSFARLDNIAMPDYPPGELAFSNGNWFIGFNNSGQYMIEPCYLINGFDCKMDEYWNVSSSIEGLENNGSGAAGWFYASAEPAPPNITQVELLYTTEKTFRYMVKDVKLGYPIAEEFDSSVSQATIYVPADRNYSIMLYPDMSFPVSYDLNNISDYPTPKHVDIMFNTTEQWRWVSGYALQGGSAGFDEFNIIAYLIEPGNMIGQGHPLPHNMSAWRDTPETDVFEAGTGFYNITLPGSVMTTDIMLFVVARNGSDYYGAFRNISLNFSDESVADFNFTLYTLPGTESDITLQGNEDKNITVKKVSVQVNNESGGPISDNAFTETIVDYTSIGGPSFSWMQDVNNDQDNGTFMIPLLAADDIGVEEMNIYSKNNAPKKTSFTAAEVATGALEVNLSPQFQPKNPEGEEFMDLFIDMIKSSAECDVPDYNRSACSLFPQGEEKNMTQFDPFKIVLGGGKISMVMRKQSNNITVHYKNVDLMASGPPDALFDENANNSEQGSSLDMAWRFGSQGPEIYDEVLIGIPLGEEADLSAPVSILLQNLYDEDWNAIWAVVANGTPNSTSDLPSDYQGFNLSWFNQTAGGMPCSTTDDTANCYINVGRRIAWLQIPHFSGIGPTVQTTTIGNLTMTADDDDYVCVSFCTIYFNVTNENFTISENLHNIAITTLDVNGSAVSSVNISWYNGTDYEYNGTNSTTQADYNLTFFNGSESTAHRYGLNVYKNSIETNLNITYNITDLNVALTLSVSLYNLNINLMSPSEGNLTTDNQPDFTFNYTYSPSATISCELVIDSTGYGINSSVTNNTPTTITANTTLAEGNHSWRIDCAKGNIEVASSARTINIDTGAPTVSLLNSSFNTTDNTTSIAFNYTDSVSSTADCSLYFNDASVANNASVINKTNTVLTSTAQSDGSYSVYVNCTDGTSHIGKSSTTISVKIDTTGPTVTINSPTAGQHVYDNTTDITFAFNDSLSPSASCTLFVNDSLPGTNSTVLNNTATIIPINSTTGLAEGNYTLKVNCTDDVGNLGSSSSQTLVIDRTAPTITSAPTATGTSSSTTTGTATITATTDENSTCWYKGSAFNATNITDVLGSMSGNSTSSHTFTIDYSADGTIGPYYISCRDVAGNNMNTSNSTGSITVSVTEHRGSSGGGGGGVTPGNPSASQTWTQVTPGSAAIMKVSNDDFGIKEITITVNNPAQSVEIAIEKLAGKPASVTKTITGKVFRYLSITKKNLVDDNVNGMIKVKFQVSQSWLLSNGVNEKNIALKRFANDAWNDLKTTFLSSDTKYAYYEAETPGLSYFAIGEKSAETPVTTPTQPPTMPTVKPAEQPPAEQPATGQPTGENKTTTTEEKAGGEKKPSTLGTVLTVLAVLLVILLVIIAVTRPRRPKHHELLGEEE